MATLNQFQQYSQGENTVTNNVLLMFSNLYELSPKYYEELINGLTEDSSYTVIPSFTQQVRNKGDGIIDGHIEMKASKIIIETKLKGKEWIEKLLKYTKSFDRNEKKLLFHLSRDKYSDIEIEEISNRLNEMNRNDVDFFSITYSDLAEQLQNLVENYPYDSILSRLSNHFAEYCANMNLIRTNQHILRAMACGESLELNIKYKIYFDLASRGYRAFDYLGLYKQKSVRYIGKIENVVVAEYDESSGEFDLIDSRSDLTDEQKKRIIDCICEANRDYWGIESSHRFFLLNDFHETNFRKVSPGGIFRVRYFDLKQRLNENIPKTMAEIAKKLKDKFWE